MTARAQLGWHVSRGEWEAFETFVEDKWDAQGPYVRFEIESAMREFLDADDALVEAERLLREYLRSSGLSSSSAAIASDIDHSKTTKLGHRINADLKDEFARIVKQQYEDTPGRVLARALNAYRTGGRRRRILENVQRVITGGTDTGTTGESDERFPSDEQGRGTTTGSDESLAVADESQPASSGTSSGTADESDESVVVEPDIVMEIGDALPESFSQDLLDREIATTVNGDGKTIEAYRDPVCNYKNVVEHPHREDFYLSEEEREASTFWADLDRDKRAKKLRRLAVFNALEKKKVQHGIQYGDVQDLFEDNYCDGPSHDYAYTLMEDAAAVDGFSYGDYHGKRQLRVDVHKVSKRIIDDVLDEWEYLDLEELTVDGLVTAYSAGPAPKQEGAADD